MSMDEAAKEYVHDYSSLESVIKGVKGFDDPELMALIKEQCGVDLSHPKHQYSQKDMRHLVEVICQARFPNLDKRQGMIKLGRSTARGYAKTLIGQVMSAPLKVMSPDRALHLLVRMLNTSVKFGQRTLVKNGERDFVLQFRDDPRTQPLMEGIVLQFLEDLEVAQVKTELASIDQYNFDIGIRW